MMATDYHFSLISWSTVSRGLTIGLTALPQGNQEHLVVKYKVGRPQLRLEWTIPWSVILFPPVLWHCWLVNRRGSWPVKSWVLICRWCRFVWSFASLTAPVVTTASIILSSSYIQNEDILVSIYPGCPGKWLLNEYFCFLSSSDKLESITLPC